MYSILNSVKSPVVRPKTAVSGVRLGISWSPLVPLYLPGQKERLKS